MCRALSCTHVRPFVHAFCFFSITAGPLEQIILRFICKVRNHKRKARILITLDFPKNISFTLLEEGVGIAGTHRGRVVMVVMFNATLSNSSVISCRGVQYYWWRKPEHSVKTIDLPLVTAW